VTKSAVLKPLIGVEVMPRLGVHVAPKLQEKVISTGGLPLAGGGVAQFMDAKKIAPPTKSTWIKTNMSEAGRNLVKPLSWATSLEMLGSIFSSSSLRGDRPTKLDEGHRGSCKPSRAPA
jgi:hypothetical protein